VQSSSLDRRSVPREVAFVWLLMAVVTAEIFTTYARLPASELYHVSHSGLTGGASRAVVFLNFPVALVAIAILAFCFERLPRRGERAAAVLAAFLSAVVFWPGVVTQADLDVRPVNAPATLGIAIALTLTLRAARRHGLGRRGWSGADWGRVVVAGALLIVASPWVAADLGFFLDGVPLLGRVFQSGPYLPASHGLPPFPPAVHHGHHHGMDGFLLVLTALLLSRAVGEIRTRGLRSALRGYLALMFCYGIGNIANDFWIEQVVKRGWTRWQIPNVTVPEVSVAWALIVAAAAAVWAVWTWHVRRESFSSL
jgi:hypothetical protein